MPSKIRKREPPLHCLVVDTNILWLKEKHLAVNPDFDSFWNQNEALIPMELHIPEVVRDELVFQHCASGKKVIDKVADHFIEFSAITTKQHRHRLTEESLRKSVEAKFDRWIKTKDARILAVPVGSINWRSLYEKAVWRLPPFALDSKNPDNEKGFRDALILETVVHFVEQEKRTVNIVFICKDELLRMATAMRLKEHRNFLVFEALAEFSSYVKLTREQLTQEFIQKLVRRAAVKFFTEGDQTSLWVRESLWNRMGAIEEAWNIESPSTGVSVERITLRSLLGPPPVVGSPSTTPTSKPIHQWTPKAARSWYIAGHEFLEITGDRTYHWATTINAIREYILTDGTTTTEHRILHARFNIFWKANVKNDARFHDIGLESVKLESKDFRMPTDDDKARYNLESPFDEF